MTYCFNRLILKPQTRPKIEITTPDPTFHFETRFRLKAKFTEWVKMQATTEYWWPNKVSTTKCLRIIQFLWKINLLDTPIWAAKVNVAQDH